MFLATIIVSLLALMPAGFSVHAAWDTEPTAKFVPHELPPGVKNCGTLYYPTMGGAKSDYTAGDYAVAACMADALRNCTPAGMSAMPAYALDTENWQTQWNATSLTYEFAVIGQDAKGCTMWMNLDLEPAFKDASATRLCTFLASPFKTWRTGIEKSSISGTEQQQTDFHNFSLANTIAIRVREAFTKPATAGNECIPVSATSAKTTVTEQATKPTSTTTTSTAKKPTPVKKVVKKPVSRRSQ